MTCCCISYSLIPCGFSFTLYLSPCTFFPSIRISASPSCSALRSKTISQQYWGTIARRVRFQCGDMNGNSMHARVFPVKKCKQSKYKSAFCMTTRKLSQDLKTVSRVHSSKEEARLNYCSIQNH